MKTLGLASFAAALFVALTAQAGDDAAQKKEKAAIQGIWKVVSLETPNGKDADTEGATLEFHKDGKNMTFTKGDETKKGTFKVNPGAKPKEIDIKPGDQKDKTFEGIYRLEKNKLTICLAPDEGDGRPSEFAVKDGKKYVLIKLERAK